MWRTQYVSKQVAKTYSVDMKLSVTLIVRNEQHNLARLLPQLGFADEVVVVDTGSDDNTVDVALRYGVKLFRFRWIDDFSAARNYALEQATGDYVMWLDADDVVPPKTQKYIMGWKKSKQKADFYYLRYRMDGGFPFWFWRERIVRRCNKCRFRGFIHEAISPFGNTAYLDCEVVHRPTESHEKRNLLIYRNAIAAGKKLRLRDKYYFGRTLIDNGMTDEAALVLRAFASNSKADVSDRVGALKLLSRLSLVQKDFSAALRYLSRAVRLLPPSGEVCCLFGEVYFNRGNWLAASEWYRMALCSRAQSGFVNEYYNGFLPNVQLSVCLYRMGNVAEARAFHIAAKSIAPTNPTVIANDLFFR